MKNWGGRRMLGVFFVVLCVSMPICGWTFEIPAQKGVINDYAGFLTAQEVKSLEKKSTDAAVRVIIVTNKEVDENNAKMARAFFDKWKIGGNDVLVIFSGNGKNAAFRIDPGQEITHVLTDVKIKEIRTVAQNLLVKSRTGEALQYVIDNVDKEVRSAKNLKAMLYTFLLGIAILSIIAVAVFVNMKAAARRRDRKEINESLTQSQKTLIDLAENVGTYTKMIGMLSKESQQRHQVALALVSSAKISESLTKIDEIKAQIGVAPQGLLRGRCAHLDEDVKEFQKSFALVDRLMADDSGSSAEMKGAGASPKKDPMMDAATRSTGMGSVHASGHAEHRATSGSSQQQRGLNEHQRGNTTIIRETTHVYDSGPSVVVVGGLGGHQHHHDGEHCEHIDRHAQREMDEDLRGGSVFSTTSDTDSRGGVFSTQPDPVINDPFEQDDRGGSFTISEPADDRGGSFVMETNAEVQDSPSGTGY